MKTDLRAADSNFDLRFFSAMLPPLRRRINNGKGSDRQASVVLIQVQPGKESGTGYDFVKLNF